MGLAHQDVFAIITDDAGGKNSGVDHSVAAGGRSVVENVPVGGQGTLIQDQSYVMENNIVDAIGEGCWYLMFISPLIIFPLVWKFQEGSRLCKIVVGSLLSVLCGILLGIIGLAICFRNGFGMC